MECRDTNNRVRKKPVRKNNVPDEIDESGIYFTNPEVMELEHVPAILFESSDEEGSMPDHYSHHHYQNM